MSATSNYPANAFFTPFEKAVTGYLLPDNFASPFDSPHPLALQAAELLQQHLQSQQEWQHNFGLSDEAGTVIGKMFGVLVVETESGEIGYLAAFSGKLAGSNHHTRFVPPIFDGLADGGFLNAGMTELSRIGEAIRRLEGLGDETHETAIRDLKVLRKQHSVSLQHEIFDQYHFLNRQGDRKSLRTIFADASYKNPPAGAGECAGPKLLQYAFLHRMKPFAMAEFWWGLSPKSAFWQHGHFYPACQEKCAPILAHMLSGTDLAYSGN